MSTMLVPFQTGALGTAAALGAAVAPGLARTMPQCQCGEILTPRGQCLNVGDCSRADRAASRGSLRRGAAASSPAAWTIGGGVD